MTADQRTWSEIEGYRRALDFVIQAAQDDHFEFNPSVLRGMHVMMLGHDLSKSPGRYRPGQIFVNDEETGAIVYEGPDFENVPLLVAALTTQLSERRPLDPIIRGGMSHLNLVMIHPFRDGNGRMARALQTLVLARGGIANPEFSSIEEWLGRNTQDYYSALALTGQGSWNPDNDTSIWIRFVIRAHHMQAQTVRRRLDESIETYGRLTEIVTRAQLPERVIEAMFDVVIGLRVRRPTYVKRTGVEDKTATRDLTRLVDHGLLEAVGERRGRFYRANKPLVSLRHEMRVRRQPLEDPYPDLPRVLRNVASHRRWAQAGP